MWLTVPARARPHRRQARHGLKRRLPKLPTAAGPLSALVLFAMVQKQNKGGQPERTHARAGLPWGGRCSAAWQRTAEGVRGDRLAHALAQAVVRHLGHRVRLVQEDVPGLDVRVQHLRARPPLASNASARTLQERPFCPKRGAADLGKALYRGRTIARAFTLSTTGPMQVADTREAQGRRALRRCAALNDRTPLSRAPHRSRAASAAGSAPLRCGGS